ncbi:hypothetical protein Leryth_025496, partial [Lithospermum erythrorhizon]
DSGEGCSGNSSSDSERATTTTKYAKKQEKKKKMSSHPISYQILFVLVNDLYHSVSDLRYAAPEMGRGRRSGRAVGLFAFITLKESMLPGLKKGNSIEYIPLRRIWFSGKAIPMISIEMR